MVLLFFLNKSGKVARLSQARKLKARREQAMRLCCDFTVTIIVPFNIHNFLYIVFSSYFCKYTNFEIRNIRQIWKICQCEICYNACYHHRNIATMFLSKTIIEYHQCARSQQRVVHLVRAESEMFLEIL